MTTCHIFTTLTLRTRLRLIAYPLMAIYYMHLYYEYGKEIGTYVSFMVLAPTIHTYLSFLNYWWTFTMLKQMRGQRKGESIEKKDS